MCARFKQRVRRNLVDPKSRSLKSFWAQLILAKRLAEHVRKECPDFDLWRDMGNASTGRPARWTVLERAVEIFEQERNTEDIVQSECEKREHGAKAANGITGTARGPASTSSATLATRKARATWSARPSRAPPRVATRPSHVHARQ